MKITAHTTRIDFAAPSMQSSLDCEHTVKKPYPHNLICRAVVKAALPEAPAEKAVPLDSVIELERAVGAVGIECDSSQPASEAKYSDSSISKQAKSKQYFELQKEAHIQFRKDDGPGASTLVGPKWMMRGDDDVVLKLQAKLSGTII